MEHRGLRRLFALFLVLALGLGPALHGVQAGEMAAMMLPAVGADMPAPCDCDGCDRDDDASALACAPVCLGPVAILPAGSAPIPSPGVDVVAFAPTLGAGHSGPPDPFPPRLPILA